MFDYTDPTGTGFLAAQGALPVFRNIINSFYARFATLTGSAFTWLEAFDALPAGTQPVTSTIGWKAFPKAVVATDEEIDTQRFAFQDEYVEWRTERANDAIAQITFTTEFPEYYQALAATSHDALVRGIQQIIPGANPTNAELYGPGFDPNTATPALRARQFREWVETNPAGNPWNSGQKGILFLAQQFNTVGALFNLVGRCAVPRLNLPASSVCASTNGACGPNRDSDPAICLASQLASRPPVQGISLADPVGVLIARLEGVWELDGTEIDINNEATNQGIWTVSRNRRRAVLKVPAELTLDGEVIATGAAVARWLQVQAKVITAPNAVLPTWARIGNEAMRMPTA